MTGPASERIGEFDLIRRYFQPLATAPQAFRLSDDAAILAVGPGEELLATVDTIAAGIHFLPSDPAASVARKALRVNLSDLAAKGAVPVTYLLALALPMDWTEAWVADFAEGLAGDQATYGVTLLGGDTTRAAGGTTVTISAFGKVPAGRMVRRSGARPGDLVFVSGTIGDGALGLRIHAGSPVPDLPAEARRQLSGRYLHPEPRVRLASVIRRHASAAMDVSDGLVGDLGHIAAASGVAAIVETASVPLSDAAKLFLAAEPDALHTVLGGGDDYEILATVPESAAAGFSRDAALAEVPVTAIGRIEAGEGVRVLGPTGRPFDLVRASFDHFR